MIANYTYHSGETAVVVGNGVPGSVQVASTTNGGEVLAVATFVALFVVGVKA